MARKGLLKRVSVLCLVVLMMAFFAPSAMAKAVKNGNAYGRAKHSSVVVPDGLGTDGGMYE